VFSITQLIEFVAMDYNIQKIMDIILKMDTSTTKLIEEISGEKLRVETLFQKETIENGEVQTIRMTRLFLK
jgi:hypothetical protein